MNKLMLSILIGIFTLGIMGCENNDNSSDYYCHNYLCSDGFYVCKANCHRQDSYAYHSDKNVYMLIPDNTVLELHYHPCEIHSSPISEN